jgi:hypothetical protein
MDMETSKRSTASETLKDDSKEVEQPIKTQTGAAKSPNLKDESPDASSDEEPGTFDRVYEHGRQMGF